MILLRVGYKLAMEGKLREVPALARLRYNRTSERQK
jgi:hypothetical protein